MSNPLAAASTRAGAAAAAARRRPRIYVSPFMHAKAWWLGLDSAENLARYGDHGMLRSIWTEWRGTLVLLGCSFAFMVSRTQSNRANDILDNIELNRQSYYRREFRPEYVNGAPDGVYDGPKGYAYIDEVSGLKINADNQIVSNERVEERRERLAKAPISGDMVRQAQALLGSKRYETEAE